MSSAATVAPEPATRGASERSEPPKETRSERAAGKGRRRRAAAEQRRIDLQRWGQYVNDEEDTFTSPSPGSRRRMQRSSRRNSARDDLEDFLDGIAGSDFLGPPPTTNASGELDVALALSLSLSDTMLGATSSGVMVLPDMSYESLVMLENVRCVAPAHLVNSMGVCTFTGKKDGRVEDHACEVCAICQCDYEDGDRLIKLSCAHNFHHGCGAEWLLKYSKLCPVCKHDVTE